MKTPEGISFVCEKCGHENSKLDLTGVAARLNYAMEALFRSISKAKEAHELPKKKTKTRPS